MAKAPLSRSKARHDSRLALVASAPISHGQDTVDQTPVGRNKVDAVLRPGNLPKRAACKHGAISLQTYSRLSFLSRLPLADGVPDPRLPNCIPTSTMIATIGSVSIAGSSVGASRAKPCFGAFLIRTTPVCVNAEPCPPSTPLVRHLVKSLCKEAGLGSTCGVSMLCTCFRGNCPKLTCH